MFPFPSVRDNKCGDMQHGGEGNAQGDGQIAASADWVMLDSEEATHRHCEHNGHSVAQVKYTYDVHMTYAPRSTCDIWSCDYGER